MDDDPMEEDLELESEGDEESDDDASSPALSAASTPPYSEEGFFPPAAKSGKLLSVRRGRGRPKKDPEKKPLGIRLKRWRSGVYVKGEHSGRSPRTPTGDLSSPWGGKSPAQSPIHSLVDADSDKMDKAFPMSAPDDPPVFTESWPGKLCALCGLSERSMLGQREMIRLSCPDGYPSRPTNVGQCGDKSPRGPMPVAQSQRRQRREGKTVAELLDELSLVGYVDEPDIATIVEPSGTFYVHLGCIIWSTGVTRAIDGDQQIEGAWPAVESGLTRRCAYCSRIGAAMGCVYTHAGEKCTLYFHYPCAVASAGFLDPQSRSLICSLHLDQVTLLPVGERSQCGTCLSLGNVSNLVMCSTCEMHHHGSCVGLALQPAVRAGWQCFECRTCQVCRLPSEIGKVMVCETCDKSYHPSCLRPIVTSIPKYGWKCKCCRVCSDCGSRTPGSGLSSRWHNHFSVCDSCYQQRNKGFCCPLCGRAYRAAAHREMVKCTKCCKFVHGACDGEADPATYSARKEAMPDYDYVCTVCKISGRSFSKRKDSLDDGMDGSYSGSQEMLYGDETMDVERSPSDKGENSTGLGKGKQLSLHSAKKRLGASRPKLNYQKMKVADLGKKRGIKSKMRGVFGVPGLGLQRPQAEPGSKGEDEPGVENRMVLCSGSDKFVTSQDMCVMCGALGTDQEGCLMACVQCGQCYHPYCVNVKVTKVILTKGWRCLDCTVCEGCGQRNDDARLTLCDDCDISYHIYCMDPPLESVPRGVWKCKWCVVCIRCGSQEPGVNCSWMNKYTECGPCASHTTCSLCADPYTENELVIQCETCSRWLHGACDCIRNEAEAEQCASEGYSCPLCRPRDMPPPHLVTHAMASDQVASYDLDGMRPLQQSQFFVDGVCLSEAGMSHIKSMALEQNPVQRKKPRAKRLPSFPMPITNLAQPTCEKEARLFATIESVVSAGQEEGDMVEDRDTKDIKEEIYREGMEVPRGEDGKPPEPPEGFTIYTTESGALILRRKRTRNLQKLGIGGFLVRMRTVRKEEEPDGEKTGEHSLAIMDKPKRKPIRRKPRSKLAEAYPSYLQDAFFGRELLDTPKEKSVESSSESDRDEGLKVTDDKTIELSMDELKVMEDLKAKQLKEQKMKTEAASPVKDEDEGSDSEVLKDLNLKDLPLPGDLLDNDLVDTIMAEEEESKPNVEESGMEQSAAPGPSKDELSDILSPHFNLECMVRDSGLPDMDGKDVEEIFKGVLTDDNRPGSNVEMTVQAALPSPVVLPPSFPPPSPYHSEYSNSPHSQVSEPASPWLDEPPLSVEPSTPSSQRSTPQKMEADEALGLQATISSVLYANTNHPEWKTQFPVWSERYKQILKKWRSLSNDQKAPYLQHARDNRSALRMKKAQQIPKESPTASTPPLPPLKTTSVGSGPDGGGVVPAPTAPALPASAEVCEEAAPALEQLTPSTNPPSPPPDPDDRGQVESASQTDELGLKGQVRVLLAQPRPQNILLRNLVIANNMNVLPPRGLLHLDLTQRAPNVTIRAFEAGGLARLHRPMTLTLHSPAHAAPPAQPPTPARDEPPPPDPPEPPDHHIRVLTPSEIMRTLPSLDHSHMDQDKALQQQKTSRESEQERQWKQLQALRQAQQHQQQQVIHDQRAQSMARINRQIGDEVSGPSPLQVSTTQDSSGISSITSSSSGGRPQFPNNPSVKVTRIHPGQSPSPFAPPMMPRTMRPPMQSPVPDHFQSEETFGPRFVPSRTSTPFSPRPEAFDQNPEVARQLRELLQRQKESPRPWLGNQGESGFTEGQETFRQPLPPGSMARPRMPGQQLLVRTPVRQLSEPRLQAAQEQRIRFLLQQQQQQQLQQQQRGLLSKNPLDPYDEMVQRPGVAPNPQGGVVRLRPPAPQSDQQEIPESVTAELEQLEQEAGPMAEAEAVSAILGDLADDDDELLAEMGPDFNILEYVDTDAGSGDKTNLLDNLDLDDEDKKLRGHVKVESGTAQAPEGMSGPEGDGNLLSASAANTGSSATPPAYASNAPNAQRIMSLPSEGVRMPLRVGGASRVIMGPGGQLVQTTMSMPAPARMGPMSVAPPPPYPGPPPPYPGPAQSAALAQMSVGRFGPLGPMYPGHMEDLLQRRPLLLQEQPLLLEDLLEQEKREQEKQHQGPGEGSLEGQMVPSIMPPMSPMPSMPVAGGHPGQNQAQVIGQGMVRAPFPRPPGPYYRPQAPHPEGAPPPPPRIPTFNIPATPPPPLPPDVIASEQDRQTAIAYESWLNHQNQLLQQQLKYYETEVQKLRKIRKSLNSKQRQQRKNGNELNETDAMELQRVTTEQTALQKHLDASRKACRQHGVLIQEYQTKQQKARPQGSPLSPMHPAHSPHHSMGFRTSPHPNTPQSPMMSPSPSPLHSPGPGVGPMQLQQSPISPHSRQPSPRMGTPHSQVGEENPFSPGSLPSPQPAGNVGNPRMASPRLVASPGLQDQGRLHAMTMGPRFARGPAPTATPGYQGPAPRLVYSAKPATSQAIQRNILLQQQQRTQQIFQQISQQNPNMTLEQKQKLLQQISQQQSQNMEQKVQQIQQNPNLSAEQKQQLMSQITLQPQTFTLEQKQQLVQQMQENPNMTVEQKQQLIQQIAQKSVQQAQRFSNEQKQQILQQISQQNPNMTMEQKQQLLMQISQQNQNMAQGQNITSEQKQQFLQQQEQKQQMMQHQSVQQPNQGLTIEQKQQMMLQVQQNTNMSPEQKQHLMHQISQQGQVQMSMEHKQQIVHQQPQQQSQTIVEQKSPQMVQQLSLPTSTAMEQKQQQQMMLSQQVQALTIEQKQQMFQQNQAMTTEQKHQLLQQISQQGQSMSMEQKQKLLQLQLHQQKLQQMQQRQQLLDQQMIQQQQQLAAQNQQRLMGQPRTPEQEGSGPGSVGSIGASGPSSVGPAMSPAPSPGGGGGSRNAPIPRPPCLLPGLRGGAPMWPSGKGKRPKRPEDEPSTSRQVSVLRQRGEGFVNVVQMTTQQQQKQHMIIQLGQNEPGSPSQRSSLVCVDYDSMDETPPVSPFKQEAVGKEEDKPEEIRLATDAEGIELLAQENLLNLELEAEDEPEDRRVIIIDNSPESEKSGVMEFVDEDLMVYEPIEDGEELVVLGECEVLEAHEFDISNCDVMEFESMEEEEDPAPTPAVQAQAEPSSKQQIIVRHTKKGKQIVMVKRGEEGKDQRQVVYRTEKVNQKVRDVKGESSKDWNTLEASIKATEPQAGHSHAAVPSVARVAAPTRVSAQLACAPTPNNGSNRVSHVPSPTRSSTPTTSGTTPGPTGRVPTPTGTVPASIITVASTRVPTPTAALSSTSAAAVARVPTSTASNSNTNIAPLTTPTTTLPVSTSTRAPTPTNRAPTPTNSGRAATPTTGLSRVPTTPVLQSSASLGTVAMSRAPTPTQTLASVASSSMRLTPISERSAESPTLTSPLPPSRSTASPSSNPILSRLVSSPLPVRTVPSPSITPPPSRLTTSPSITSAPVRLINVPASRPVTSPNVPSSPVRLVTSPNIMPTHLRLVSSPNASSSLNRLVSSASSSSHPSIGSSPNNNQSQIRIGTSQNLLSSPSRLGTTVSPTRLVSSSNVNLSPSRPVVSSNVIIPLNRPVTVPSTTSPGRTLSSRSMVSPIISQSGTLTASMTPSAFAVSSAVTFSATSSVTPSISVAPNVISVLPAEMASKTPEVLLQSDVKSTLLTMALPKKDEIKPVIPTLSFPDFPEGLASKFMSAECSVIKKPEMSDTSPIRAAKTYEKSRHGKPKVPLTEHDYTSSQKPVKIEIDEADITSHIAKIDPKVRDIISISKITQEVKKIDRRKSMETISKRRGIEERRRSSENKRELEQRRLMILEEIKQEKKATGDGVSSTSVSSVAPSPIRSPTPEPVPPPTPQPIPPPTTASSLDFSFKTEHDLSDVIDILENIDSTTPTRLLSSSELLSIEKTPLFENEELEKSPVKSKTDEKINIQSLLNESGKSDLQMSDLARGVKNAGSEARAVQPQPPPSNQSKLAALLTGGKVPTLESLLEKDIEDDEKKVEPTVEIKPEPSLLLSPTSGILRNAQSTPSPALLLPPSNPPAQSPAERMAEIQKDLMSQQGTQTETTKSSMGIVTSARSQTTPTSCTMQYVSTVQHNPPLAYQHSQQHSPLPQKSPIHHQQQQCNFPQVIQQPQEQFQHQLQHQSAITQVKQEPQQHMMLGHVPTHQMSQPPRFQLVASSHLQRLSVPSAVMSTSVHPSRMDESQNVLLKQLLQNTGCAAGASSPGLPRSPTPSTPSPITSPTIKKEPLDAVEVRQESAEELKKLKRRQYQQKRRQSQGKEGGTPKKRARKGSRMEEDYESYTEGLMSQLKQLAPLSIMEPNLPRNFGVCPVFGSGDNILPAEDFYCTKPFGAEEKVPPRSPVTTQRGFYDQEFATVQLWSDSDDRRLEMLLGPRERDTDTPDTVISSSSPECVRPESPLRFPALQIIKEESEAELYSRSSPAIPLVVPIPVRPRPAVLPPPTSAHDRSEDMKENKENAAPRDVRVTLTLNSDAARDVLNVLKDLANLLHIPPPTTYQIVERTTTPPSIKLGLYRNRGKDGKEGAPVDIQSILNGQAKFCKHCDVVILGGAIRKKVWEVPFLAKREDLDNLEELHFCSPGCYMQFSLMHKSPNEGIDRVGSVVDHIGIKGSAHDRPGEAPPSANRPLKGNRFKLWQPGCLHPPTRYKKPTERELMDMLFRAGVTLIPSQNTDDTRRCLFCHQVGDGVPDGPARLLNFDVDKWVHLNCALWSDDVYERVNGALMNVDNALQQGQSTACALCGQLGATLHCFKVRCSNVYHLSCAVKDECVFFKNKTTYCPAHVPKNDKDNELTTLSVYRRVYVQRDEERQVATMMHNSELNHLMRVGSLIFLSVGQLLPHQLPVFHTPHYIYPVGYKIVRFYWSMRRVNKRCPYVCSVHDASNRPEFRILVQEAGYEDIEIRDTSAKAAWLRVLEPLEALRREHGVVHIFPRYVTGEDLFGLTEPAVVRVLESLPGVETLTDYKFKYGRNPLLELPLAVNPTGCARSEPRQKNLVPFKRPHTQRTGTCSRANLFSPSLPGEPVCPYSKQFVHSKSSQYKKMKLEWRNNVYLARSKIQGLGLYAARDLERHTMVIEYIGEIIRHELSESREKQYESRNRGIYMFRMDEERVVDATISGGLARYINHSCNPNCVTEIVEVDRELRIIIFAKRRISRGEELAYDYKFDIEDDQHKIPCLCGAPNCRKWMN